MKALILVDLQNDFLPGGALAISQGDQVIAVANRLQTDFGLVVATKDWHPPDHGSFAANHSRRKPGEVIELDGLEQILWPVHCVQGSQGSELAADLDLTPSAKVFFKGVDPKVDSYSTFFDNASRRSTGLADYLRAAGVDEVFILGLATDYCVKFSALDALELGFRTYVVEDGCRGVDLEPGDSQRAFDEMRAAGVEVIHSREVPVAAAVLAKAV
ncbi:MAG: bifunctional nicotinamidase/pyrazinamidase [Thermoanaerobaculia bacterium]